jgi:hypothetical protein
MAFEQEQEIEFKGFKAYPDGSGAPVTVNVFGNIYSFDFLGELKTHGIRIRPAYGNRARGMRDSGLAQAKKTYLQKIKKLGPEWLQKNLEIYPGGEGLGKISFAAIRERGGEGVMNPRKAFEQALGKQASQRPAAYTLDTGDLIFYDWNSGRPIPRFKGYYVALRESGKRPWLMYTEGEGENRSFRAIREWKGDEDALEKHFVMKFDSHAEMWDAIDVLEKNGMRIALSTKGGWTPGEHRPVSAWVDKRTTSLQFLNRSVADQAKKLLQQQIGSTEGI